MNAQEYHAKRALLLAIGNAHKHHARLATRNRPHLVSRAKAKQGRKANRQDMHEFWRVHLQYNPNVL